MVGRFPGIAGLYVARQVVVGIALILLALVALYSIIDILREMRDVDGAYGPLEAVTYVLWTSLRRVYDVFPFAALIGTLLALGGMAASQELTALRVSGVSRQRIAAMAAAGGGAVLIVVLALTETFMPGLETDARTTREQARTGQVELAGDQALWLRDGPMLVRVDQPLWAGEDRIQFERVDFYRMGEGFAPEVLVQARRADHDGSHWRLQGARTVDLESGLETSPGEGGTRLESRLDPAVFEAALTRPRFTALGDLVRLAEYMEANGLDASAYRSAFWGRVFYPLTVLAMIVIGLPFVFRPVRERGWGLQALVGIGLGLSFHVLNRLLQGTAAVLHLPPWLTAAILPVTFIGLAWLLLRRRA